MPAHGKASNTIPTAADQPTAFLHYLFNQAVRAVHPTACLPAHLQQTRSDGALVIGAGKAAAAMAQVLEENWQGPLRGLVITPYGHNEPCKHIEVVEAAHPVPDRNGSAAAARILQLAESASNEDHVVCLLSGGGSSLLALPAPGISLADKQHLSQQLLRCGAPIAEINCVRKHLSRIKGGRLAAACAPARLSTYAISDAPGDDPATLASGPTSPDNSTAQEALQILQRYELDIPKTVGEWLTDPRANTIKADHPAFATSTVQLVATAAMAFEAARSIANAAGIEVHFLGDDLQEDANTLGKAHAEMALSLSQQANKPQLLLSGGETHVTVTGTGQGGRNTQYLLAVARRLAGAAGIYALAADTDGIDGSEDNAGACLTPQCWRRAERLGLDTEAFARNNDSYNFFKPLDTLLVTGPTRTNVNDFRALLVFPQQ